MHRTCIIRKVLASPIDYTKHDTFYFRVLDRGTKNPGGFPAVELIQV